MIKFEYLLLCDFANITQEGKLNVSGVFNNINIISEPAFLSKAVLVGKIFITSKRKEKELNLDFNLIGPTEDSSQKLPSLKLSVPEAFDKLTNGKSLGFVLDLINLPIKKEGLYKLRVTINGKIEAETVFTSKLKK